MCCFCCNLAICFTLQFSSDLVLEFLSHATVCHFFRLLYLVLCKSHVLYFIGASGRVVCDRTLQHSTSVNIIHSRIHATCMCGPSCACSANVLCCLRQKCLLSNIYWHISYYTVSLKALHVPEAWPQGCTDLPAELFVIYLRDTLSR